MIDVDLERLLAPLERFEQLRRSVVRLGDRLADLSYANPLEGPGQDVRDLLHETLADTRPLDLQYAPNGGLTLSRRAVAESHQARWQQPLTYRDVVLTLGAAGGLQLCLRALGRPGDEVVVLTPCWLDHPLLVAAAGRRPVLVPLAEDTFTVDADAVAAALGPRTATVLLANPQNPAGRIVTADELAALAAVLADAEQRHGRPIDLVVDEAHRDLAPDASFVSGLDVRPRAVVVHSFGKAHLLQGQHIGYAAVGPAHPDREGLRAELERWARILTSAPTTLMQRAVPRLLERTIDDGALRVERDAYLGELVALGYEVVPPDGTWFVYARTPAPDDFEFTEQLARAGLLVLPAPVFHHRGWFRLSLTATAEQRERSLASLAAAR